MRSFVSSIENQVTLQKKFKEKVWWKIKTNQVCEDQKQMFVVTLSATYDWIIDSSGSATFDIWTIMVQLIFHCSTKSVHGW